MHEKPLNARLPLTHSKTHSTLNMQAHKSSHGTVRLPSALITYTKRSRNYQQLMHDRPLIALSPHVRTISHHMLSSRKALLMRTTPITLEQFASTTNLSSHSLLMHERLSSHYPLMLTRKLSHRTVSSCTNISLLMPEKPSSPSPHARTTLITLSPHARKTLIITPLMHEKPLITLSPHTRKDAHPVWNCTLIALTIHA
jgi:hypothetical protein